MSKRTGLSLKDKRRVLWERQEGLCGYCNNYVAWEDATLEHVKPRGRGGGLMRWENLLMACEPCNNAKSAFDDKTQNKVWDDRQMDTLWALRLRLGEK